MWVWTWAGWYPPPSPGRGRAGGPGRWHFVLQRQVPARGHLGGWGGCADAHFTQHGRGQPQRLGGEATRSDKPVISSTLSARGRTEAPPSLLPSRREPDTAVPAAHVTRPSCRCGPRP